MSFRRRRRYSDHRAAKLVKYLYDLPATVPLPCPRWLVRPFVILFLCLRSIFWFLRRVLFAEPFFKSYCLKYGQGLHTGIFLHWIQGNGDIIIGDHVKVDGKCSFKFAARYSEHPQLVIGSYTGISHGCGFTVGKQIVIGDHCRLAGGVEIMDSAGHANEPQARMDGQPALDESVKPVIIGNNVWIGRHSIIFPGVEIGDNAIIASHSAVFFSVLPNTIVAGNPARAISSLESFGRISLGEASIEGAANALALNFEDTARNVVGIVKEIGGLRELSTEQDFYDEGLTSMASLTLMLRLESEYHVTIPDEQFLQCRTAKQIAALLLELAPD